MASWAVGGAVFHIENVRQLPNAPWSSVARMEVNEEVKAEMIKGEGNLKQRRDASQIDRGPSIVDHVWGKVA